MICEVKSSNLTSHIFHQHTYFIWEKLTDEQRWRITHNLINSAKLVVEIKEMDRLDGIKSFNVGHGITKQISGDVK